MPLRSPCDGKAPTQAPVALTCGSAFSCPASATARPAAGRRHERGGDGPVVRGVLVQDAFWGMTQLTNVFRDRSDTSRYGPPIHREHAWNNPSHGRPRRLGGVRCRTAISRWASVLSSSTAFSIASRSSVASTSANPTLLGGNLVDGPRDQLRRFGVLCRAGSIGPGNQTCAPPGCCGYHDNTQPP